MILKTVFLNLWNKIHIRFLRGGSETEVLQIQEDSLQDHLHSVTENGHSHGFTEYHYFEGVDGWYGPASAFNYQTGQSSQKILILVQYNKI